MIAESSKCSYCKMAKETIIHIFKDCPHVKKVWSALKQKISIDLPDLTSKSAFFGFYENDNKIVNHIHIIFKLAIFNNRDKGSCNVNYVLKRFQKLKKQKII